jgi:hypothetical protein
MSKLVEIKVRAPCRTCNSNFFNELEVPCRPFLAEAIADRSATIDADAKRAIATYAYKTALLLNLNAIPRKQWPRSVIDQCALLYQTSRAPVGVRVWIGRFDLRETFPDMVHGGRLSELQVRLKGRLYRTILSFVLPRFARSGSRVGMWHIFEDTTCGRRGAGGGS